MTFHLFQRRVAVVPTFFGWLCIFCAIAGSFLMWWFEAEAFLSETDRIPGAEVLVVEGWIGNVGVQAAMAEFEKGGYKWLVTTGGYTNEGWSGKRWNYSDIAGHQLLSLGFPKDHLVGAPAPDVENQRTYESAEATYKALVAHGIPSDRIVVFTRGSHARRSRLIFSKVFEGKAKVGVISWMPEQYQNQSWWHVSIRADDLLKESVGYLFEVLASSGRGTSLFSRP
jgi:uncharacterized SAM-binding protein YcdF (DUF218 family)